MIPEQEPVNNHYGNNLAKDFDFDFYIENENQLLVTHTDLLGVPSNPQLGIDYKINEIGNKKGSKITFPIQGSRYQVLAWDEGSDKKELLTLSLNLPASQEAEYTISDDLNKENLEQSFDKLTRLVQILKRRIERAIKVPEGSGSTPDELIENVNQAQVNAQNFANVASTKADAAADSAVKSANQAAISTGKTLEVKETYDKAMTDIAASRESSLSDVAASRKNSLDDIEAARGNAAEEITTGRENIAIDLNTAKSDINTGITEIETTKIDAMNELRIAGYGFPPDNCKGLNVKQNGTEVLLSWRDPDDTVIDGQTMCTWKGTKIIRQEGRYPLSPNDGVVIVDCKTRNIYEYDPLTDNVPDETKQYYYTAFPYSANNAINYDRHNRFGMIIFGFIKEKTDANPATRVTYIEDNKFFRPVYMDYTKGVFNYGDWADAWFIKNLRPCMLKYDGTVDYELNKNDYTLKTDGTASDVSNAAYGGNAMVGFPTVWIKYEKSGTKEIYRISNVQVDETYYAFAHTNKLGKVLDEIFLPCYEGSYLSGKARSISDVGVGHSQNFVGERTLAKANGEAWDILSLSDVMMIRILGTLIGKSTDSQTVFGNGHYIGGSQVGHILATGSMNKKGMFSGTNVTWTGVKMFGIENPYGNVWKRITGWVNVNGTQKVKMTPNITDGSTISDYNDTGDGYITIGCNPKGTSGGYISETTLIPPYGSFPVTASGSSSTYECDGFWFNNAGTMVALVGGDCTSGLVAGLFSLYLFPPSGTGWNVGSALSCKPLS